jgi:pimeloyl-ACP methyl ester carboxylesterase
LFYNPGGPGGSATQAVLAVAQLGAEGAPFFSENLLNHYDILGLDPRGVGLSAGVKCDPELWNARKSIYPANEKEFEDMVKVSEAFHASCKKMTGSLFEHLDTTSVAEDFEIVRHALDEGKLNYFGQSYGSQIGEQYAELYPENIGRMALDGILDHSTSEISGINVEVCPSPRLAEVSSVLTM